MKGQDDTGKDKREIRRNNRDSGKNDGPEADFADGAMSTKLRQLRSTDPGTTFSKAGKPKKERSEFSIDLAEGAIIGGAYRIIKLIGKGGMGEVYLAEHMALQKKCALKVIPPEQVTEEGWRRFQQEAKTIAKLDHINLVKVSDLGIHEGCLPFYAMEWVQGETLADTLAREGPIKLETLISCFTQVCDGLDHAHRAGIIHRDLKPGNIMVARSAGKLNVKILDFGLAKLTQKTRDQQSLTTAGDIFGSPFYMSPEQCNGDRLDQRTDIYSLGCTMFELLTGQPPFTGTKAAAIVFSQQESPPPTLESRVGPGKFPPVMELVIAKLLRKNPAERYQTLAELRAELEKIPRGENVVPSYISLAKKPSAGASATAAGKRKVEEKPANNNALVIVSLALVLLLAGIGFGVTWYVIKQKPAQEAKKTPAPTVNTDLTPENPLDGLSQFSDGKIGSQETPADAQKYENMQPIVRRIDTVRGTVTYECPDLFLGEFCWHVPVRDFFEAHSYENAFDSTPARGKTTVPAGVDIIFGLRGTQNRMSWRHPSFLRKFDPAWLKGLRLVYDNTTLEGLGSEDEKKASAQCVNELIKAASGWTELSYVEFVQTEAPDGALYILDGCPKLTHFTAAYSALNPEVLGRRPFLRRLRQLRIKAIPQMGTILAGLKGSTRIEEIMLSGQVSTDDIRVLTTCPALRRLELYDCFLDDDMIDVLCNIKSLRKLVIGDQLPPKTTNLAIANLGRLKKIEQIDIAAERWPLALQLQVRRLLPRATLHIKRRSASLD